MMNSIEIMMMETTAKVVQDTSKEIAYAMQIQYDDFFADLLEIVAAKLNSEPAFLAKYLPEGDWMPISTKWSKEKTKWLGMPKSDDWHYNGLSNVGTMAKGLSIRRKYGRGQMDRGIKRNNGKTSRNPNKINVPPFVKYIKTLQAVGTTERFFGPVSLQYEFQAPDIGHTITPTIGWGNVKGEYLPNIIKSIQHRNRGQFAKFPSEMRVTATVEAFGILAGLKDLEWFLVDYIIKRIDPANEKQWVKINGTRPAGPKEGSHGREVKPLIQPLVRYYLHEALPNAIKRNIKGY